jgi:predicted acetyltransferase
MTTATFLIVPTLDRLPAYVDALERAWSPNTMRPEAAQETLALIATDAALFVERQTDLAALGGPVILPDGTSVPRIPGRSFWIFDGGARDSAFCGAINLRWQPGTAALPPHVLGHVGYTVVPWQRRRGHAGAALRALLPHVREAGLPYIEVTTDPDNLASRKVIEGAGGVLIERTLPPPALGRHEVLRYRIDLDKESA